ncbi:TPA: redox-regulated ATPase YchF [Candidatus Komeilibacteria bacterium]|nr:MAG: GTP-binding protein YchF [Parcubacteria group bacterium GW2011_GWF2_45_11]KKT98702.1 MAG: GTP-binding protein YchF [Parcubacteria group bacterium GW2011_GWC2_45_15]OGY93630.1 MAG: redox-regulated ATPase YchF [Candidatus Komeilibacteria bacterium RIFOXYA2_FULL_45_9]OGY94586.1 MAG: redox-regulated ATPase YchF [Candidatus Komeilibacteria bacterium RIFOXYC2_FULL_45_12]HAH04062.1 redox-regulated ATPase YchF [Candidatus Komeilibacteria bacterium]
MSFSIGIVGLPNVGKSTLFTALTKKQVDASNYPFCTIEPNIGVVAVPDERLDRLTQLYQAPKTVPTTIEFVDIAGLVKGASEGEGLGNKFLSHIREVDAIVEVVRDFKNDDIIHVHGKIDPEDDIKTINWELILADLDTVNKRLNNLEKQVKGSADKNLLKNIEIIQELKNTLAAEKFAINLTLAEEDKKFVKELNLLTYKPLLYVYNVAEENLTTPIAGAQTPYLTVCAKLEADLAGLPENEVKEYLQAAGIAQTGLDKLILQSYNLLNLLTFFTAGPKEAHAWTIVKGTKAPQAAGRIHTDFEKGFIRAEIVNWAKLLEAGGETKAKEVGLIKTEGRNYEIQDGDVACFLFNKSSAVS